MNKQRIIDEYSESYCYALELAYGRGMMSEGGAEAIEHMFSGIEIRNKKLLDVGFGLGGVAIYLARKHHAIVSGIEINPWMVEEANKRVSLELKDKVYFYHYDNQIPFKDLSFDVVYSKGVLCHLEDKRGLFCELFRVLKPGGQLVINDWLSPVKSKWSDRMQEMCELEDLTLFAETEVGYHEVLLSTGFKNITITNENKSYAVYNREIAACLDKNDNGKKFVAKFGESELKNAIKGYLLIAEAIENDGLLIRNIVAEKLN